MANWSQASIYNQDLLIQNIKYAAGAGNANHMLFFYLVYFLIVWLKDPFVASFLNLAFDFLDWYICKNAPYQYVKRGHGEFKLVIIALPQDQKKSVGMKPG